MNVALKAYPLLTLAAVVLPFGAGVPSASAETVIPIAGTGFSQDILAEKTAADPDDVTTFAGFARWVLPEVGAPNIPAGQESIPTDGLFTSKNSTPFQFEPFDQNNVLLNGDTFTLTKPGRFEDLRFLITGIGGNAANNFQATVFFTDNSSTLFEFSVSDWQASRPYNAIDTRVAIVRDSWTGYFGNGIYLRELIFDLTPADQAKSVRSIDFALADRLGLSAVSGAALMAEAPFRLAITANAGNLDFEWDSVPGMFYVLRSSADLASDLATWESVNVPGSVEVDGLFQIATDPPINMHTIPRPGDPTRFYRVEELPLPPVTIFEESFDSTPAGMLPVGWSAGFDASDTLMNTAWELGAPSGPASGPSAAHSGANCVGTNLTALYGVDSHIWLRSAAIDLTAAAEAALHYREFKDIEAGFDFGTLAVLDAADDSVLAVIETDIDGVDGDWQEVTQAFPAEALGKSIRIEFRFQSDNFGDFAGWYIDDVRVTTPAP